MTGRFYDLPGRIAIPGAEDCRAPVRVGWSSAVVPGYGAGRVVRYHRAVRRIGEIRLPFDHDEAAFAEALGRLGVGKGERWRVLRKSLDARRKGRIQWVYAIGVEEEETRPSRPPRRRRQPDPRPVIVGAGPAGLFAAQWLLRHGVRAVLLEQGEAMPDRLRTMARFMRRGELDERSNLCFGAGGAGAYSDGKLLTRIRSPHVASVMETFVSLGAPEEIRYAANPHLGSNGIRRLIQRLIQRLQDAGVDVRFGTAVAGLAIQGGRCAGVVLLDGSLVPASHVILAVGHSARPVYRSLVDAGLPLERKGFAVGARLEHPAELIERIQYGDCAGHPALPPATYRLASTWETPAGRRALYSFCMCPRGHVLNAATERDGVVSNGMSNRPARSRHSNSAFVVPVHPGDIPGDDPLAPVHWQRELEVQAAGAANPGGGCHALPAQRLVDFLAGRATRRLPGSSATVPLVPARLDRLLPGFVVEAMCIGFDRLGRRMCGLVHREALLVGVETRTSAPLRIPRDPASLQCTGLPGLFPVGEGAGYAGGVTSAAVDGIAAAEALLDELPPVAAEV